MKTIIFVTTILAVAVVSFGFPNNNDLGKFKEFMVKYDRKYETTEEFNNRFEIFKANLKKIELLQQNELGTAKYGITKFADRTYEELFSRLNSQKHHKSHNSSVKYEHKDLEHFPKRFDWRHRGAVTPVKDQGQCGSCWAFSAIGNIEGQNYIKYGKSYSLSEQELIDCQGHSDSCSTGGWPFDAYFEAIQLGGLQTEKTYPYVGEVQSCNVTGRKVRVQVTNGIYLSTDEVELAQWLVQNGPISVALNANSLPEYISGIIHSNAFACDPTYLDHAVLIVGYGVEENIPYWIVKNSWAADWGEDGYFRIYRGDGTCGINTSATTSVID